MLFLLNYRNEEAVESMRYMIDEVKTGEEAFIKAHGANIFETYEKRPESSEAFTKCMKGTYSVVNPATAVEYDFSQHHTLLDLGGGMGSATATILSLHDKNAKKQSKLSKAIVFDLQEIVARGELKHPLVQYSAGSFFEFETIPKGADCILINGVLHDWNDEECVAILTNAANALEPGGRIIVTDIAVPDPSSPMYHAGTRLDVFMMTVSSGYFRTQEEYNSVWEKAKLKLVETRPTRGLNSLWILSKY